MRPPFGVWQKNLEREIGCHACVVDYRSAGLDNGQ